MIVQEELKLREEFWCPHCGEGRPLMLNFTSKDEDDYTAKCLSCGTTYSMSTGVVIEEKEEKNGTV